MRVVIKQCNATKYLARDDRWVARDREALNFPGGVEALDYIRKMHLRGVQLVLKFGDDRFDLYLASQKGG